MSFPEVVLPPHELRTATAELLKGVQFVKFNGDGRTADRFLTLDRDQTRLVYLPSAKDVQDTTIYFRDIVGFEDSVGGALPATENFKRAEQRFGLQTSELAGMSCFAIVYRVRGQNRRWITKTLNLGFRAKGRMQPFDGREDGGAKQDVVQALEVKNRYLDTVVFLTQKAQRGSNVDPEQLEMLDLWMEADRDNDRKLTVGEIHLLLRGMQVELDKGILKNKFDAADDDKSGFLTFDEFRDFYRDLTAREEMRSLFVQFAKASDGRFMSASDLTEFLSTCQGDQMSEGNALRIIRKISRDAKGRVWTLAHFTRFMLSQLNSCWKPHHVARVHQDMDQPLHQYYINTSHNTFLTGDQLTSRCSVDVYATALAAGARCVEVHVHEGMDDSCLYVSHGTGLKVRVEEVFKVIERFAFKTNPYPVIIVLHVYSREVRDHQLLCKILRETFKSQMLPIDEMLRAADAYGDLRGFTPNALQRRFLIMCRMRHNPVYDHSADDVATDDEKEEPKEIAKVKATQVNLRERSGAAAVGGGEARSFEISEDLSECIFLRSTRLRGWRSRAPGDWPKGRRPHEVASFSEGLFQRVAERSEGTPAALVELNRNMMCRVYPNPTRTWSDNFLPAQYWEQGVSMVALNFQKTDYPLRLNESRFRTNGGCGYVLKPVALRRPGVPELAYQYVLTVRVLSGSQLPSAVHAERRDIVDPYVGLWIQGIKSDCSTKPCRTAVVEDNGFKPVWEEKFDFRIRCLELATLTMRVYDYNGDEQRPDEPVGEANVPLTALRLGYRCVPLHQLGGARHGSLLEHAKLFCHFSLFEC